MTASGRGCDAPFDTDRLLIGEGRVPLSSIAISTIGPTLSAATRTRCLAHLAALWSRFETAGTSAPCPTLSAKCFLFCLQSGICRAVV